MLSASYVPCAQTTPDRNVVDLQEAQRKGKLLLHFCGPQPQAKANAAVLVGLLISDRWIRGKLLCPQGDSRQPVCGCRSAASRCSCAAGRLRLPMSACGTWSLFWRSGTPPQGPPVLA